MSGFYGGDTEQMRAQAQACELGSQRIQDVTDALGVVIDSVPWFGPDAIALRTLWHGTVKPGMIAKAEDIRAKGGELDQHATEQDTASGTGGGAGGGAGAGGDEGGGGRDEYRPGEETYRYGDGLDYGDLATRAGDERPIGQHGDGIGAKTPPFEGDWGSASAEAGGSYSGGAHTTTDQHGNVTASAGGRAQASAGAEGTFHGPGGGMAEASAELGITGYGEAGATFGPDGGSAGAAIGAGAYANADGSIYFGGIEAEGKAEAFAGAEAHANAYSGLVRNDDGHVNGIAAGFDAGAFAGAKAEAEFKMGAPGGWFSSEVKAGVETGGSIGAEAGYEFSTDRISFRLGGALAPGAGGSAAGEFSFHPNNFVNSFTPGDYDLDDGISDLKDWTSGISPWW
ncbi:MAG: hypothetical protein DI611_09700 [Brachybacterium faecium]|uniref:hypothetical protein n=1 Tax=Brachybacterium muris TaxID=219301 RepID=UPI000DB472CD|nr:hypothetical protein [Brachybacterium muris]MCT1430630.1 hypothetical protein [Brachybacterium muris]PZP15236.1 MAG: hypothetical protein DI611_09700 [Brachybacterium faecium]